MENQLELPGNRLGLRISSTIYYVLHYWKPSNDVEEMKYEVINRSHFPRKIHFSYMISWSPNSWVELSLIRQESARTNGKSARAPRKSTRIAHKFDYLLFPALLKAIQWRWGDGIWSHQPKSFSEENPLLVHDFMKSQFVIRRKPWMKWIANPDHSLPYNPYFAVFPRDGPPRNANDRRSTVVYFRVALLR